MFGKFQSHFGESQKPAKWIIFRLMIFPVVNWVCLLPPVTYTYIVMRSGGHIGLVNSILYSNSCAAGFYNFLALACTVEFRDAIRLHKDLNKQKLMETSLSKV